MRIPRATIKIILMTGGLAAATAWLAWTSQPGAPAGAQAEVRIAKARGTIWIDGNLDEPDWVRTPSVGPFLVYPTQDPEKGETTEAKMLWDDRCLYIAFKTLDRNILATRTARHADVFNDDCVEAFLSPFPDRPTVYTNIEINALATFLSEILLGKPDPALEKMPLVIPSHYTKKSGHYLWSPPGLQIGRHHQGTINDESDADGWWTIELSLPWETFAYLGQPSKPKAGNIWRFNLFRLGGKTEPERRNLFFVPSPLGNHSPDYYGRLVFADENGR